MQPRKPDDRKAILRDAPSATSEDLAEYERLLSKRFSKDPSKKQQDAGAAADSDDARLKELSRKLFGTS